MAASCDRKRRDNRAKNCSSRRLEGGREKKDRGPSRDVLGDSLDRGEIENSTSPSRNSRMTRIHVGSRKCRRRERYEAVGKSGRSPIHVSRGFFSRVRDTSTDRSRRPRLSDLSEMSNSIRLRCFICVSLDSVVRARLPEDTGPQSI